MSQKNNKEFSFLTSTSDESKDNNIENSISKYIEENRKNPESGKWFVASCVTDKNIAENNIPVGYPSYDEPPQEPDDFVESPKHIFVAPASCSIKKTKKVFHPSMGMPSKHHVPKSSECSGNDFSDEEIEGVKSLVKVIKMDAITTIVGVVVDKSKRESNEIISIKCCGSQPLNGYIYDHAQDSYLIQGVLSFDLGRFDFALKISLPGIEEWSQTMPIPVETIEKHFSAAQRKIVEEFRRSYPGPKYTIKYVQMISN